MNDKLFKELNEGYPAVQGEPDALKGVFADYRILEEFKGKPDYKPVLLDVLGLGTGPTALRPGFYYFVMLPPIEKGARPNITWANFCNFPLRSGRLEADFFKIN